QRVVDRSLHRERLVAETVPQRRAVEQLGNDVRRTLVPADVMDGDDIRMVEPARSASLLLEAAELLLVEDPDAGENLDCHVASQLQVARREDAAHASVAQLAVDAVAVPERN